MIELRLNLSNLKRTWSLGDNNKKKIQKTFLKSTRGLEFPEFL